jgi:Uma2 family endonuclease
MDLLNLTQLAPERLRPIARREYELMVANGSFANERVELLGGVIVQMSPQAAAHVEAVKRLQYRLLPALLGRAEVLIQSSFGLSEESVPEPDLAVVPPGDYWQRLPDRAYLLVEVAQMSLRKDRLIKAVLYAEQGVPEYWLVNLVEKQVEVYREPTPAGYRLVTRHGRGETLRLVTFPDVAVRVAEILPPG